MAAKPSDNQLKELTQKFLNEWRSEEQIYKMFVKKGWIDRDEELEKKFEQEKTPEQEEQPTPEAWPGWETINWVEDFDMDSATDDVAKDFISTIDAKTEEWLNDWSSNKAHDVAMMSSNLTQYSPIIYQWMTQHPGEAAKIVEKAKDINTLSQSKALNFLDNLWWKLMFWSDKTGRWLLWQILWADKWNKWYKPFAANSSETKQVVRALWKTNADNAWILNKSVWTISKDSNAFSNLTKAQKISWALQIIWMAAAAADWVFGMYNDTKNWTLKVTDNEALNRLYSFSDYIDTALTDMIPWVWLINAWVNMYYWDDKDENWLAKGRGWVLTKLWLDFWTEKDENKRNDNKKTYDWLKERWYTEWLWQVTTKKWSKAEQEKWIAKATTEVQNKEWRDSMWDNAFSSANRQLSQLNHVAWNKVQDKDWKAAWFTIKDLTDKFKWIKSENADWTESYDWVNKKTNQPLSSYINSLSSNTKKSVPNYDKKYKKDDESPINI